MWNGKCAEQLSQNSLDNQVQSSLSTQAPSSSRPVCKSEETDSIVVGSKSSNNVCRAFCMSVFCLDLELAA